MNYEEKATHYAEKYGIVDYTVNNSTMTYYENFQDGTYMVIVDLNNMKENRKLLKNRKQSFNNNSNY